MEIDVDDFTFSITVATRTHFLTTRAAATYMIKQGSGIVLMFGGSGSQPLPGLGGFKIALDALEGLRRQWAIELGPHGVRVVTRVTGGIIGHNKRHGQHLQRRDPGLLGLPVGPATPGPPSPA